MSKMRYAVNECLLIDIVTVTPFIYTTDYKEYAYWALLMGLFETLVFTSGVFVDVKVVGKI